MASELWGFCGECERWFYCSPGQARICPVCGASPVRVERRDADTPAGKLTGRG
jgi:hypothetical protein